MTRLCCSVAVAAAALCAGSAADAAADRRSDAGALETVPGVDLERYAGRWFEIARLPNRFQDECARDVSAEYIRREDGRVTVVNRCTDGDGLETAAQGVARIPDPQDPSKLKVRFAPAFLSFIPAVWGDYWIIDLAPDYSYAVVGEPSRRYLWILSRTPRVEDALLDEIFQRIRPRGYDPEKLTRTRHSEAAPGLAPMDYTR